MVLIPKIKQPVCLSQFRPIELCNTIYKTVTKVIVNKIKEVLPALISPKQSSFVPGHHITNNIVIAQELIHSMHTVKRKKGFIAIKADLETAFIEDTFREAGFPNSLVRLIMITTSSIQAL